MRHSHVFNFCQIFFKMIYHVFQRINLYGIANQRFPLISSIQYGRPKSGKWPLKWKFSKNEKQSIVSYWLWVADDKYDHIFCVGCITRHQITETTVITVNSSRQLNKIGFNNFMKKCHDNPLIQCQNFILIENFK